MNLIGSLTLHFIIILGIIFTWIRIREYENNNKTAPEEASLQKGTIRKILENRKKRRIIKNKERDVNSNENVIAESLMLHSPLVLPNLVNKKGNESSWEVLDDTYTNGVDKHIKEFEGLKKEVQKLNEKTKLLNSQINSFKSKNLDSNSILTDLRDKSIVFKSMLYSEILRKPVSLRNV